MIWHLHWYNAYGFLARFTSEGQICPTAEWIIYVITVIAFTIIIININTIHDKLKYLKASIPLSKCVYIYTDFFAENKN